MRITWISYKIHVTLLRNCSALKMSTAFFRKHMSSLCCLFYFITTSYYILTFYCRMIEDSLRSVFTQFNFFIHNLGQMKFSSHQEGALLSFVPKTYRSVVVCMTYLYNTSLKVTKHPTDSCDREIRSKYFFVDTHNSFSNSWLFYKVHVCLSASLYNIWNHFTWNIQ